MAFGSTSGLTVLTSISERSANRLCVAPADGCSGACLGLFGSVDGAIQVNVTFGNNATRSYISEITVD